MKRRVKKPLKNLVALTLTLLLTLGQVLPVLPLPTVQAAQPVLTITGTGLNHDVLIFEEDWSNYDLVERFYSSNNNYDYHKIWKAKGYDIFDLIGQGNLKTDQDYNVAFISALDGGRVNLKVSELESQYYHPDFTESNAVLVAPMLSFYRTAVFEPEYQRLPAPGEVIWTDRALTESDLDTDAPRLMTGQPRGEVSKNNQSFFNKQVCRIVVGEERPSGIDFDNSPYKHITHEGAPYNVDTYTGATMTVEGPGVHNYNALSMRQLEEVPEAGLYRGDYLEQVDGEDVERSYEGVRISYILDNFITLKPTAGNVVFKNYQRQVIATYTLEEIRDESRMFVAAYGVNEVPLVYKKTDDGYDAASGNDGGCLKLVLHPAGGGASPAFDSLGYIYVEEADTPGFEHNEAPYDDPDLTQYIFTLSGSGLGKEANYTTADLEAMTELHHEDEYSSSNSEYYWYYNIYKGVPLWDLLLEAGMDENIAEDTPVNFIAADHYNIPPMTVGDLKYPDRWGYYEKSAEDLGDGTFDGSAVEPIKTGYPVLVAYGVNGYPYVKDSTDPGFNSGLGNRGGPLRIIFGKKDYDHTNGSHQVKYALRVVVGEDLPYTTHSYAPYDALADETLSVTVVDEEGITIKEQSFTVGELEDLIYGESVSVVAAEKARAKARYNIGGFADLYEGVDLSYLLFEEIGLPGTMGTVTFTGSGEQELVVNLADITRSDYFNKLTGVSGLKPVLAFAKNGYPLVKNKGDQGYLGSGIVNRYGPLMVVFGQTTAGTSGQELHEVNAITVNMVADPYAHLQPPYDGYADVVLNISGDGARKDHAVTVGELEFMQNYVISGEYCLARGETKESALYRGIDIYDFLQREVGFSAGADKITFRSEDGFEKTFALEEIAKGDYLNEVTGAGNLKVMLAFGKNETPLVPGKESEGYKMAAGNDGGPLRLVIGQIEPGDSNKGKSVGSVVEIVVDAVAGDSWKHDHGLYTQYLDLPMLRVTGSQVAEPRTFTLRQLQALDEHILRDIYMGDTEVEGIIVWNLIKDVVGLADGVTTPSGVRVYSGPGYNQIQETGEIMNGVLNSLGLTKEIILGYAIKGHPLVPDASSPGYVGTNQYGPLRLIVEENNSRWTKNVDCIVVGTGGYEEPLGDDLPAGPAVLTVAGDGVPGGAKEFTLDQLKALGETSGSYSYASKGDVITDECTGVLLADVLAILGVTNPAWTIELLTTDGYEHETYIVDLQQVIDDAYLVTYEVNGSPVDPDGVELLLFRHHDDGSTWFNKVKGFGGVAVTSTDLPVVLTVTGDGVPGGSMGFTLDELKALGETIGSYSYSSKGNVKTDLCTGVLLVDILANLGVTNPSWEIELLTTDGYEHETYIVDLQQVIDDAYLVTYEVNGSPVDPDGVELLLFRNHDDGSTWFNKVKGFGGVQVKKFIQKIELPPPGTVDNPAEVVIIVDEVTDFYLDLIAIDSDKYTIKMVVPAGVATPTLKFNTVEAGGGQQAVLPALILECELLVEDAWQLAQVVIPAGTTVTGPANWDGVLHFPEIKESPSVTIDGDVSAVIEIGFPDGELLFDQAVRIFIPGQAGKIVGFVRDGRFVEITRILGTDNEDYANDLLPPGGEGKIEIGSDLVIWTKHLTEFVTYAVSEKPGEDAKPQKPDLPGARGGLHTVMQLLAALMLLAVGAFFYCYRRETA